MTAPGTSALAVVRIAGPGAGSFLDRRFSRTVAAGRPAHGELRDDSGIIDDPVVVLREDGFAADITLHGGAWISRCVIELAAREGFVLSSVDVETIGSTDAETIFEHELLVSLPKARTELAVRTLLAQPKAWQRLDASAVKSDEVEAILADCSLGHLLSPPTFAIVGLPNAGKSTLANQLFGQQRSIVSPIAGTTRDWVGEEANLDGLIVKLIDTPGRRVTEDAIEHAAILASDAPIRSADAIMVVLDATRDDAAQATLVRQFPNAIAVLNKIDVRHAAWTDNQIRRRDAVVVCAQSGAGIDALTERIRRHFGVDGAIDRPRVWTQRQRREIRGRAARL